MQGLAGRGVTHVARPTPSQPVASPRSGAAPWSARGRQRDNRARAGDGEGGGGEDELQRLAALRAQAAKLNDLFFSADAPPGVSDLEATLDLEGTSDKPSSSSSSGSSCIGGAPVLPDLPLWRVQWAALPGSYEVLHVHVPHYVALFSRLLRQPRPWRYGSLYLPDGSKSLGSEEYALVQGSKAPLAGTLMEVLQAVRFADGRLLILAMGVGRFVVRRQTQELPYSRADVQLLVDGEEQQVFEGLAMQALESVRGGLPGGDVPLPTLMAAVPAAARAAAAAYSQSWVEYELSDARQEGGDGQAAIVDGTRPEEAQRMGRRLAAIAGNEVLQLPFFEALQSAAQAAGAPGMAELLDGSDDTSSILLAAVDAQRPVLRQAEAGAYAAATAAAAQEVARQLAQLCDAAGGASSSSSGEAAAAIAAAALPQLNTAAERGVDVQAAEEVLGEDALEGEPDSLALALRLEAAVWQEVDAVHALASKLRERVQPLPGGLACLRPMQQQQPQEQQQQQQGAGEALQAGAPPGYPALRRLQHLAYAVTAMLANVSATEGRQAWVEAGSLCARLRLGLAALRKHRQVLAAVVAVEGL